ncbi:MAG: aldehyde ferredoxin oxidoreductase N-terminal domain-containing protein [Halobacteriota archaeon]|nr:aldehyde ferredoxin oxidoreductase N-terminal domain-containing protein [Halobacteriota archaeon]
MYYGYAGNILHVDLTTGKIGKEPLDEDLIKDFIGGLGINLKLAYDLIEPGIDPLSPDNPIIIGAGPLVGTVVPATSRIYITSKMPINGSIGWAGGSMSFGCMLKNAGYDHVIVTGRAESPVYLSISDDDVHLNDASHLWGKDTNETADELWKMYDNCGVISIGQAGENMVKISMALVDRISTLGRGGFGAVMGSKNLKAIITRGTKGVEVSDRNRLMKSYKKLYDRILKYPLREEWMKYGLIRSIPIVPKDQYIEKLKKARIACPSCPIGDKDLIEIKEGEFAGMVSYQASIVNAYQLGVIGAGSYDRTIKCFDMINRYGLDSVAITNLFLFVFDLYKRGVITDQDTDGLALKKNFDTILKLLEMTSYRQGFGDILAEGLCGIVKRFGDELEEYTSIIKGMSFVVDPKMMRLGTIEFEQIVNPRGPQVASGGSPTYFAPGRPLDSFRTHFDRTGIPEDAIDRIFIPPEEKMGFSVGRLTRYSEDWFTVLGSLGVCARAQINRFYSAKLCAELYSAVTGRQTRREDHMKAAERAWNLYKVLNVREGFNRKDDLFPEHLIKSRLTYFYGGVRVTEELAEKLLDDYYDERGWDVQTGIPTTEKLVELGLDGVAEDLKSS